MEFGGVPEFASACSGDDNYRRDEDDLEQSCHLNALGTGIETALVLKHIPQDLQHIDVC